MILLHLTCLVATLSLSSIIQTAGLNEELLTATRKNDLEKVKALLAKGADVNAKSPYGATPLFFACDRSNAEIVKVLLDNGADVNTKDSFYGATPLGWALGKDQPDIIRMLVEKGAGPLDQAMGYAINRGHVGLANAVLARGGLSQKDLDNHLRVALRKGNREISQALKAAGAHEAPEFTVEPEKLKIYAGVFKSTALTLTFKLANGKLSVSSEGFESELIPLRLHTFEVEKAGGVTVVFNPEGDGVGSLIWKTSNGEVVLRKGDPK